MLHLEFNIELVYGGIVMRRDSVVLLGTTAAVIFSSTLALARIQSEPDSGAQDHGMEKERLGVVTLRHAESRDVSRPLLSMTSAGRTRFPAKKTPLDFIALYEALSAK